MNTVNRHISSLIGYALMATQIGFDIKNEKKKNKKKKRKGEIILVAPNSMLQKVHKQNQHFR